MRADPVPVSRWGWRALIIVVALVAAWLLSRILREHPTATLLVALLLTLVVLCVIAGRAGVDSIIKAKRRAWLFPALCSVIAAGMSMAGLNGSSSAELFQLVDGVTPATGLILGEPKLIRSDEWMVHTPWLLSQAKQIHPFSSHNPSVGGKHAPLVCNLPVAHWSMCFRPELWAFFAGLTPESAFAVFWNFKWWSLLCGSYVLLLVLTRGESLLSAAGALLLLWTSTIQWWFSSLTLMPDMLGLWCFALGAGFGSVVHPKRWLRGVLSGVCAFCTLGFLFCCYPPFQIPLATLFVPLLITLVHDRKTVRHWMPLLAAASLVIVGASIFVWQLRGTLSTISALAYPGRRFSTGGEASWTSLVHGFITLGVSQVHYPETFENVVAASSFLNVLPLLACVHLAGWWRTQRQDVVQSVLLGFAVFTTVYAICGWPPFFAKILLWSYVPAERLSIPLALVCVLAVGRFLSSRTEPAAIQLRPWYAVIGSVAFGIILFAADRELHSFVPPVTLAALWLFYSVAGAFLVARLRLAFVAMALFPLAFITATVNPLNRGIPAYGTTSISPVIAGLRNAFPRTRWIVTGAFPRATIISAMLKATGATVLSGATAVPNQEMLDGLDPNHANTPVYSRYAAVCFLPGTGSAATPEFELQQTTIYSVRLPLTDQWLGAAGIDGVVVLDTPDLELPQHYREVASVSGCRFWIRSPAD